MTLHSKISELCEMAQRRGGRCLSDTYINCNTKLLWQCSKSHQWEAVPRNIKAGHWCPACAIKKVIIDDLQEFVSKRGGCCLSGNYVNNKTKLLWECSKGHQWEATPGNIKNGRWCPTCAGVKKLTIADMQKLAKKRGGRCLSGTYINSKTKLLWECSKGHRWLATAENIKNGHWCPTCAGVKKLTIADMQKLAKKKGGRCLSGTYVNSKTKLLWKCSNGHQWKAIPRSIKDGSWCPICFAERQRNSKTKSAQRTFA